MKLKGNLQSRKKKKQSGRLALVKTHFRKVTWAKKPRVSVAIIVPNRNFKFKQ